MGWDDLEERFRSKVKVAGPEDCWDWQAAENGRGYGLYWDGIDGQRQTAAHRVAFARAVGPIPAGLHVCHRCDNTRCVNPAHLFLSTAGGNMRDAMRKGRTPVGEDVPQAKLTLAQVKTIRNLHNEMEIQQKYLARLYGVTKGTVSYVLRRGSWRHVA